MKDLRMTFFGLIGAAVIAAGLGNAHAAERYTAQTTATVEITAGSTEGRQIQEWLIAHKAPYGPGVSLRFASNDRITITRSTSTSGTVSIASTPPPPVPLPATGNPGDTISITHTSGGWLQSWSFQWSGNSINGSWGLISYRIEKVKVGPAPG